MTPWTALVANVAAGQPEAVRVEALWALCSLALELRDKQPMWQDVGVKRAILASAHAGQPESVRVEALKTLRILSRDDSNKQPMWQDEEAKHAIIAGAVVGQPEALRGQALAALCNLALDDSNAQPIWHDANQAILEALAVGQPLQVRLEAAIICASLSEVASLRPFLMACSVQPLLEAVRADANLAQPAPTGDHTHAFARQWVPLALTHLAGVQPQAQASSPPPAQLKPAQQASPQTVGKSPAATRHVSIQALRLHPSLEEEEAEARSQATVAARLGLAGAIRPPASKRASATSSRSTGVHSSRTAKIHLTLVNYSLPDRGLAHHPSIEEEEAEARSQAEALARRRGNDVIITTAPSMAVGTPSASGPEARPPSEASPESAATRMTACQPTARESGLLPADRYELMSTEMRTRLQAELDAVARKWGTLEMVVGLALLKKKIKPKAVRATRMSIVVYCWRSA